MPKMKRHGADTLWKVGTYEETVGEQMKRRRHRKKDWDKTFLHTNMFIHTNMPHTPVILHTDSLPHWHFYTIVFTLKHCYTQTLLHTDALTQTLLHRESFTHKHFKRGRFYRQSLLHTSTCTRRHFTRTNQTRKKPSVFDTQTSFRSKGLPPDQPKSQKIISFWHSHLAWCETVAAEDVKLQ